MSQLVLATAEFDKAQQAAATEGAEEDDTVEEMPKTIEIKAEDKIMKKRRTRFGTLSKSLKRAFGKSKKKKSQLQMLADARRKSMDAGDVDWPEEANPYTMLSVAVLRQKRSGLQAAQTARRDN